VILVDSPAPRQRARTRRPDRGPPARPAASRAWRDGTRAIRFTPTELIEKLAAMIPKPRINLLVYHGAFAPHARGRREAVRRTRTATEARG